MNHFDILEVSRRTQELGIRGAGSPVCFIGPPGTAKTQTVVQYGERINYEVDVIILSRIPSVDVGGIYAPDFDNEELKHFITKRLVRGPKDEYEGRIIFIDELGNADEAQQTSIQSLIEDRMLEGVAVPDDTIFFFATNRADDNTGTNEIVQSLRDRLFFIDMEVDADRWIDWALDNGVEPRIVGYISWSKSSLHSFDPNSEAYGQPSPRSWVKLSHAIQVMDDPRDMDMLSMIAAGIIGPAEAASFAGFCRLESELPLNEEIFLDPEGCKLPSHEPSALYAVSSNLAYEFATRKREEQEIETRETDAVLKYLRRMSPPMAVFGFRLIRDAHPGFMSSSEEIAKFLKDFKDLNL